MGIHTNQYIVGKKSGVFAYLEIPSVTNISVADTWTPVLGAFINNPIEDFNTDTSIVNPGIKYIGSLTQYFEIDFHISCSHISNGSTVSICINKNGITLNGCTMSTYLKTSGEPQAFSGTSVIELSQNDEIQIVIKASKTGDVTINNFVTSISEFFD
jgi:hypothetical protein